MYLVQMRQMYDMFCDKLWWKTLANVFGCQKMKRYL